MERNVEVVKDLLGNKVVVIQDIRFKGKRAVRWSDVEKYLKQYVGEAHIIKSTNDLVYIGADLPDEYTHSNYTHILKGANGKAERYNVFQAIILVRHAEDGKLYLYDIIKIKKETSNLFQS